MTDRISYFLLYKERPRKFTAEEVEFIPEAEDNLLCCSCMNWFYSPSMQHSVCQVFRPDDDSSVSATASCKFWTKDNEEFPHLEDSDAISD